ncbi:MAG TPA: cytochrome c [Croceibacterium sp.]|nr:cytochrome c [Croceibacterium sp.]
MTRPSLFIGAAALAFFAVSATAQSGLVDVRAAMQDGVNPAMLAIWDVSNSALNDEGGINPALVDDAQWASIADAADQMAAAGESMAAAESFIAAAPGNTEVGDGEISMAAVQQHIDADPAGLKQMAAAFTEHARQLSAAARAKDAVSAGELITEMDGVCESCHSRYWYPE